MKKLDIKNFWMDNGVLWLEVENPVTEPYTTINIEFSGSDDDPGHGPSMGGLQLKGNVDEIYASFVRWYQQFEMVNRGGLYQADPEKVKIKYAE